MSESNHKKTIGKILLAALGVLILLAALFSGIKLYLKWTNQYFFGHIVEVTDGGFLLKTKGNEIKTISINDATILRAGFSSAKDNLTLNKTVIVIGPTNNNNQVDAKLIRLIGGPNHAHAEQK